MHHQGQEEEHWGISRGDVAAEGVVDEGGAPYGPRGEDADEEVAGLDAVVVHHVVLFRVAEGDGLRR